MQQAAQSLSLMWSVTLRVMTGCQPTYTQHSVFLLFRSGTVFSLLKYDAKLTELCDLSTIWKTIYASCNNVQFPPPIRLSFFIISCLAHVRRWRNCSSLGWTTALSHWLQVSTHLKPRLQASWQSWPYSPTATQHSWLKIKAIKQLDDTNNLTR